VIGSSQSSIDLGVADPCEPLELVIDYRPSVDHGHDAGTTHNVPVSGGHSISYGGKRYELDSYHFHTPSEHSIDGEFAAAEIHLVHTDVAGDVAVLGVLVDESEQSAGPLHFSEATAIESLLPDTTTHYAYEGFLTTPPYTEGVVWIVMKDNITLHPQWIETFNERYGANNRRNQPLNGRNVMLG
jgi:carbonic anhydrase